MQAKEHKKTSTNIQDCYIYQKIRKEAERLGMDKDKYILRIDFSLFNEALVTDIPAISHIEDIEMSMILFDKEGNELCEPNIKIGHIHPNLGYYTPKSKHGQKVCRDGVYLQFDSEEDLKKVARIIVHVSGIPYILTDTKIGNTYIPLSAFRKIFKTYPWENYGIVMDEKTLDLMSERISHTYAFNIESVNADYPCNYWTADIRIVQMNCMQDSYPYPARMSNDLAGMEAGTSKRNTYEEYTIKSTPDDEQDKAIMKFETALTEMCRILYPEKRIVLASSEDGKPMAGYSIRGSDSNSAADTVLLFSYDHITERIRKEDPPNIIILAVAIRELIFMASLEDIMNNVAKPPKLKVMKNAPKVKTS